MSIILENFSNILEFIPTKELSVFRSINKTIWNTYIDYIYFRCASDNVKLLSNDYLVSSDFTPVLSRLDPGISEVLDKIIECPYFCIAGGFVTQCYLGNVPKVSSDIDVYVLGGLGEENSIYSFYDFIDWFYEKFGDFEIRPVGYSHNIYILVCPNFPYEVQFIFTKFHSLMEVLSTFDNSHNRCGMYLRQQLVGPDAVISKSSMTTYFYIITKNSRYMKARNLGYSIYNLTDEQNKELLKCKIVSPERRQPIQFIPDSDNLEKERVLPINFIKDWLRNYHPKEESIESYTHISLNDYESLKNSLDICFSGNLISCKIIERTSIFGLTIKRNARMYIELDVKKLLDDGLTLLGIPEQLKKLKQTLLDITTRAHGLTKPPQYILEDTRDLIGGEICKELCRNNRQLFKDIIKKIGGIPGFLSREVKKENFCPENYLYDTRLGLLKHLGYEYRDYISTGGCIRLSRTSCKILNDDFKRYRIELTGRKLWNSRGDGSKFLIYGYWEFCYQKYYII